MSTRYMKKVYGSDVILDKDNDGASDIEISVTNDTKSKSFNVFNVLNQNSDNDEQEISDKQDEEDLVTNDTNCNDMKRKKKKKKRKKLENIKSQQHRDTECNENVDEIERSILEVNKLLGEPVAGCSNQVLEPQWINKKTKEDILSVQHKHLNPYNELKRIFGSKTVQAERSKSRNRGRTGHLKKTWLVCPRDNWPPIGKSGLSMSLDNSMETAGNVQYFVFEHSSSYKQTQMRFLQAVESLNPENIISIINIHSYHVDALLQVAELCKLSEDLPMAAQFVERALYCLECAFHPSFNVTTAQCRLDYRKQQNRALFITLFKHLGFVGGRACYRTSLEFCKLLLSLDPDGDPLAMVLAIDFYALRSKEYEWFIEFCDLWESARNLTQLPNIAYSLALAHFRLGNKSDADTLLQNALIMFPGVLMLLIEKCSIQSDVKVMGHEFFNSKAQASTSPALEKLQNLYVVRCFHVWKEADILPWLEKCVHAVLKRIEAKDDYVKYCQLMRSKRYQGRLPKNILRHIILADMKEVIINVQEIQNEGPVLSHDPLPPIDTIDIYKRPTANDRLAERNSNVFSLFFTSLFTDINGEVTAAALNGLNLFEENDDNA
ncbi:ribosome quality control complex subunit TCF25 [Linepithema humile]|uniref:ribosome quality control complex subunit TCF25 n=1 Tax=Linepithema humile TaxID=83485 RepID=UPI000623A28D|nr:PREDICTED: transcription factor 25 [Linepithema humile]